MLKTFSKIAPVFALAGALSAAETPAKPNIIFILVDDLGYGDVGVFYQNARAQAGLPAFKTPNLDRFAGDGLRLDRHYCPSPVSAPSRASLLTGVHQGHASVRDNDFDGAISDNHTLATVLKKAGYATANIGKWGLQGAGTDPVTQMPAFPMKRGFDYFFGYVAHGFAHYHYPNEIATNANPAGLGSGDVRAFFDGYTNIVDNADKCYSTDIITARTKKWIVDQKTANPEQPFFIYLAYTAPHARLNVPTQAYPAGGGLTGGLQWLGTPHALINTASGTPDSYIHPDYAGTTWPEAEKRHATMVRRVDDAIGDIRQLLADLNIADNTLIIFSSDNGPHNESGTGGSFTQDPRYFRSYGPLDGIKRDMWEGGARVPTIVTWPAKITAGGTSNFAAQFHDWMPTFAELAGVPQPERSDGVSLVPMLTGHPENQKNGTIYSEYQNGGAANTPNYTDFISPHAGAIRGHMQMVFINGYKAVRNNVQGPNTLFYVYDTATDVQESKNLAGKPGVPTQQEILDRITQLRRAGGGVTRSYDSTPVTPVPTPQVIPGLHCRTYQKTTPWVPNWETETPATTAEVATPADGAALAPAADGGALLTGYIRVPTDGNYTFYLTTAGNNGAFVRLYDAQLIDADYGYIGGTEANSGTIPLKAGYHPISIHYRHVAGDARTLSLKWSGPGIGKQEIPATAYCCDGIPVLTATDDTFSPQNNNAAPVTLDPLANDTGANISLSSITPPHTGNAAISPDGKTIRYTPVAGFYGTDFFTYTITDGTDFKTAKITVNLARPITNGFLWLPFDETAGNIACDAGGNPIGIIAGCTHIAGARGNAFQFNGTSDQVVVLKNNFTPPTGNAARTITAWIKPSPTQPQSAAWLGYGTNSNGTRFTLRLETTAGASFGRLRCEVQNGYTVGTKKLTDGQWHHVAVVIPAGATNVSNALLYVDGEIDAKSLTLSQTLNTSGDNDIIIGSSPHSDAFHYAGGIDDVRIYARALGTAEIVALKNRASAGTPSVADRWFYRTAGLDAPSADDWKQDANGDGVDALTAFCLGGNPTVNSVNVLPIICKEKTDTSDTAGDTDLVYNRRRDLPTSDYVVEISETLRSDSWKTYDTAGKETVTPHPDFSDYDIVRVKLPEPTAGNKALFARLRLNLQ